MTTPIAERSPTNPTTNYTVTDLLDSPRVLVKALGDVIALPISNTEQVAARTAFDSTASVLCYNSVIESFANPATEDIFNGVRSAAARRLLPVDLFEVAFRKLDQIDSAVTLDDLKVPPGNRLEALRGDRIGQYSIRINDQYRVCFIWTANGASDVEIVDYH